MSGRGETPERDDEPEATEEAYALTFGQTLYDEDGEAVGTVRGMEQGGVFVTTREGYEALSGEHAVSRSSWGEAELMWRCINCGEMGEIDEGLPEHCPSCGADREALMYWTED